MYLCIISGLLTGITFIFKDLCFLNLFTLIPLFLSFRDEKRSFVKGFLYSFGLNSISMSFLFNVHPMEFMGYYGFESLLLVFLMYLAVCLYEGILGGIFVFLYKKYINKDYLFPLFYTLFEIIISIGTLGLTFSHLYLPWYKNIFFIQSASIFGCYFITLIIVYINYFLYKFIVLKKLRYVIFALLLFCVNSTFGLIRMNILKVPQFKNDIALIQGNLSSLEKWENNSVGKSFDMYQKMTVYAKAKYNVDAVIWPETVINTEVREESYWYEALSNLAFDKNIDLFAGCFYKTDGGFSNSILTFDKTGKRYNEIYSKRHLIPIAEKGGFGMEKLTQGKEAVIINSESGKVGGLICIDSAYSYFGYDSCRKNCDYLLVATNDSWFKDSFGVENHFAHSVFRAIENNKYLLRVGNTGITAVIDPIGKVSGKIEPLKRGITIIKGGKITSEKE